MGAFQRVRDGKKDQHWSIDFRDQSGIMRRMGTGLTLRRAAEELERKIIRLVEHRRAGLELSEQLTAWLESLPAPMQARLADFGVVEQWRIDSQKPLADLLEAWRAAIVARGSTEAHAAQCGYRATRIIEGCGFRRWSDVAAEPVTAWLAEQRAAGMATHTSNEYLGALKAFGTWMRKTRRTSLSRLESAEPVAVKPVRPRRTVSNDELNALLAAAWAGRTLQGVWTGERRALCWWLFVETSLRLSDMARLTREQFTFDAGGAWVDAYRGKTGKMVRKPIYSPALAEGLQRLMAHLFDGVQPFPVSKRTVEMLRADLRAAGIPYKTAAGTFDIHALRHQSGTLVAASGVPANVLKPHMDHASLSQTDRYTTARPEDRRVVAGAFRVIRAPWDPKKEQTG